MSRVPINEGVTLPLKTDDALVLLMWGETVAQRIGLSFDLGPQNRPRSHMRPASMRWRIGSATRRKPPNAGATSSRSAGRSQRHGRDFCKPMATGDVVDLQRA
jgi:hypothetical protein